MMGNKEAIAVIKIAKEDAIGKGKTLWPIAFDVAIDVMEKQEPQRPNDIKCDHIITGYCSACGNYVSGTDNYCSECGQRIQWNEESSYEWVPFRKVPGEFQYIPEGMKESRGINLSNTDRIR